MISCPTVTKRVIRTHYDLSTLFYRLLWGPHIHHGLWDADESPRYAQVRLTERLADLAEISDGQKMIDVGCGMGGSSIHLAKTRNCTSQGVTISRVQKTWASLSAKLQRVGRRVDFQCIDAEIADFPPESVDVVWSVECTEHLFDKPAFFRKAAGWLKPGGRTAICAWLAGDDTSTEEAQRQVQQVCEGFFCPSLGSQADYIGWMRDAGLELQCVENWTDKVARTWEICRRRVDRTGVRWIARALDRDQVMFLDRFDALLGAYRSGAMQYGCFVFQKPDRLSPPVGETA